MLYEELCTSGGLRHMGFVIGVRAGQDQDICASCCWVPSIIAIHVRLQSWFGFSWYLRLAMIWATGWVQVLL